MRALRIAALAASFALGFVAWLEILGVLP